MRETPTAEEFLASCAVDPAVFALRPDYRALLVVAEGIDPSAPSSVADDLIARAEEHARTLLAGAPVDELPHIAAWREAYRAFGAKPQRTRNSLEALTRRADKGLPRINSLTDAYNAICVLHQIPLGGEDLDAYAGPARLARAAGDEPFETFADGAPVVEHPEPGEVIWHDDAGVTCRRWNWRQGPRTALTPTTTRALFILDALAPVSDAELLSAADDLVEALSGLGGDVRTVRRLLAAN
ncbi:B3/B4 domain-containing protein [Nigerium massiliense]|uniref:B3/B4 domain-containing protein n=1 Tax=Nigerium massiliense TaxID=1522317 RepID=UPI00058EDC66|nr:phenylalanine--tRNA ligase beta subunit-related protein [Nigerium massiliense]